MDEKERGWWERWEQNLAAGSGSDSSSTKKGKKTKKP
jgi:hypothetical protein